MYAKRCIVIIYLHQFKLKSFEEKVPGKVGECIVNSPKINSFLDPKAGLWTLVNIWSLGSCNFALLLQQNLGIFFCPPGPNPGSTSAITGVLTKKLCDRTDREFIMFRKRCSFQSSTESMLKKHQGKKLFVSKLM